ncbi:hypothetical protein U1Q18_006353 [Sarracenia purpurea var. burkii]
MELTEEEANIDVGSEVDNVFYGARFSSAGRRRAYFFDEEGNCHNKEWVLVEVTGKEFCWYHIELPKGNLTFAQAEHFLEDVLRPPFRLDDIRSLVSTAPFFGHEDGALVFTVNSPGHGSCKFPFRIAARITENSVITVSLNGVPRLENPNFVREEQNERDEIVIREDEEQNGNPVPKSASNLVVHIVDSHVDHIEDIVSKLEIELNAMELEMDEGTPFSETVITEFSVILAAILNGNLHEPCPRELTVKTRAPSSCPKKGAVLTRDRMSSSLKGGRRTSSRKCSAYAKVRFPLEVRCGTSKTLCR